MASVAAVDSYPQQEQRHGDVGERNDNTEMWTVRAKPGEFVPSPYPPRAGGESQAK